MRATIGLMALAMAAFVLTAVMSGAGLFRCDGTDAYMIAHAIRLGGCVKN